MQRRISITSAFLLVLAFAVAGALLGYLLRSGSDDKQTSGYEHVLGKAPAPPKLPRYEPGHVWVKLPKAPSPEESETSTEAIAETGVEAISGTSGSSSGGGSRRHYGFSFGR